MKKQDRLDSATRTRIGDIREIGTKLSDHQLRGVAGGMMKNPGGGGGHKTIPSSITAPGEPDTATDWES